MFQQTCITARASIIRSIARTLCLQLVQLLVYAYRALSPLLGTQSCCRHTITCSEYFLQALQRERFSVACMLTLRRFMRCNPFSD